METTDREPKVGDMVFAWDVLEPKCEVTCGILNNIEPDNKYGYKYWMSNTGYKHCSLKNPLIK